MNDDDDEDGYDPSARVLPADTDAPKPNVEAFALGHSNGGFLAHLAAATMPRLFRAVVPISGYQYDVVRDLPVRSETTGNAVPDGTAEAAALRRTPVAFFLHHGDDDVHVRAGGCCTAAATATATATAAVDGSGGAGVGGGVGNSGGVGGGGSVGGGIPSVVVAGSSAAAAAASAVDGSCCCGISQRFPSPCVSAENAFRQWAAHVNGCVIVPSVSSATWNGMGNVSWSGMVHHTTGKRKYRCTVGDGCVESTAMCMHHGGGHFVRDGTSVNTFDATFGQVMIDAIFAWFANLPTRVYPTSYQQA